MLDFDPYRQNSDFYYLTGWNEPGAALLIVGPANEPERPGQAARSHGYKEILFLPTRNMRMERLYRRKDGRGNFRSVESHWCRQC